MPNPEEPVMSSLESQSETPFLMQPNGVIDQDTAAAIAVVLGKDSAEFERAFDRRQPEQISHRTNQTMIRPGFNYTVPLGPEEYAPTDKYLFINKVKPLKRKPDTLRCQMTVIGFDEEGSEVIEGSWKQYFDKNQMIFSFRKGVKEQTEERHTKGRNAAIAGMVVTVAGIVVVEEVYRHFHKKQQG